MQARPNVPRNLRPCQRLGRKRSDPPVARRHPAYRRRHRWHHFSARWVWTLRRLNIPIFCHANKADALASSSPDLGPLIRPFDVDGVQLPGSRPRAVQRGPTDCVAPHLGATARALSMVGALKSPPVRRRAIDARVLIRAEVIVVSGKRQLRCGLPTRRLVHFAARRF